MLLQGKIALITGASRGIGRAIAELFVEQGAALIINGKSDAIHDVAKKLTGGGGNVVAVQGNICEEACIQSLVKTCRKLNGELNILVNNAGILTQAVLGMITIDSIKQMLDVNLVAMINLTQYAVRLMANSASPSIINLASIAGTQGIEGIPAYSASKAAVVGFTLSAAKELAPRGIRVNAIAPGFIDTDMSRALTPEWYQKRINAIRMGQQIGTPRDVANCALFLASDLSTYVTGQVIGVDGGMAT